MIPTAAFDRYLQGESLIHRLDPRVKVVIAILYIVSNLLLPDGAWWAFLGAGGFLLLAARLARLPAGYLLRRSFLALPFALAAVTVLFSQPGQLLWSVPLWRWTVTITDAGLLRFASILARSWLSVQMAILLTATTAFPDLMHGLRHLRMPAVLIAITGFMYRYLFVLADEAARLLRARAARSAAPSEGQPGGTIFWRAQVAGSIVGQLFLRSYERNDRVYNAMLARGYQGQLLTMTPHVMRQLDWLTGAVAVVLLAAIQLASRLSL
jgi:cobalt/nickel transport system permease protein